jgi:hypothetical protein
MKSLSIFYLSVIYIYIKRYKNVIHQNVKVKEPTLGFFPVVGFILACDFTSMENKFYPV